MDFDTAIKEYQRQDQEVYAIDYAQIDRMLIQAAKDEFGFTDVQANFIHGKAYEKFHSHYEEMVYGMQNLCQLFHDWDLIFWTKD